MFFLMIRIFLFPKPSIGRKRMRYVYNVIDHHDVVFLCKTHGRRGYMSILQKLHATHLVLFEPAIEGIAGGVIVIFKIDVASKFSSTISGQSKQPEHV